MTGSLSRGCGIRVLATACLQALASAVGVVSEFPDRPGTLNQSAGRVEGASTTKSGEHVYDGSAGRQAWWSLQAMLSDDCELMHGGCARCERHFENCSDYGSGRTDGVPGRRSGGDRRHHWRSQNDRQRGGHRDCNSGLRPSAHGSISSLTHGSGQAEYDPMITAFAQHAKFLGVLE
jgi:hypothetical protein